MSTYYISPRRRMARRYMPAADSPRPDVYIPVDVVADDEAFRVTALVPGISAEDVKIEVLEDIVSIQGEFPVIEDEDASYLLRERPSGSFSRKLRLPSALDAAGAEAEVKDGILILSVPKAEEAKAKHIKVKAK